MLGLICGGGIPESLRSLCTISQGSLILGKTFFLGLPGGALSSCSSSIAIGSSTGGVKLADGSFMYSSCQTHLQHTDNKAHVPDVLCVRVR